MIAGAAVLDAEPFSYEILVVDDEEANRLALERIFAREGWEVVAVGDGRAAVDVLRSGDVGVVVTDHNVRETLRVVDRAYLIHKGKVLTEGSGEHLLKDEAARKFYLGADFNL